MTPFLRLARRTLERFLGTWDEGPEPPERLRDLVMLFANEHPRATRREWVRFAAFTAEEAYRTGYQRGYQHAERQEAAQPWRAHRPEDVADEALPGWRHSPSILDEQADDRSERGPGESAA